VLKQVEALLTEGRAVGKKELSEYLEVRGYATAADWATPDRSASSSPERSSTTSTSSSSPRSPAPPGSFRSPR
jgi:hypothetical protein